MIKYSVSYVVYVLVLLCYIVVGSASRDPLRVCVDISSSSSSSIIYMRSLLGWLETRPAQITLIYLEIA